MYQVINSTSKTQRKGFVVMINPEIYNRIAEEIIYPNFQAIKPIKIHLTPNGVIIEKCMMVYGKQYKAETKIHDFNVEGDFADSVNTFMEDLKCNVFTDVYNKAKQEHQKEINFSK